MSISVKIKFSVILLFLFCNLAIAQVSGGSNADIIVVQGTGEISFQKAIKNQSTPSFADSVKLDRTFDYTIKEKKIDIQYDPELIKAPKITLLEPLSRLYKAHIDLGINDFVSPPYLDFSYATTRNQKYNGAIKLNHFSSGLAVQNLEDSRFTESSVGLNGKIIGDKHNYAAFSDLDYNTFRFYGYNPEQFAIASDTNKIHFLNWQSQLSLASNHHKKEDLSYKLNANYQLFSAHQDIAQHLVGMDVELSKWMQVETKDSLIKDHLSGVLTVKSGLEFLSIQESTDVLESVLLNFKPQYNIKNEHWDINLGTKIYYLSYNPRGFNVYPNFDATFNLLKDALAFYVRWDGDFVRHHYQSYFYANPFINSNLPQYNEDLGNRVNLGLKGAGSKFTTYAIGVKRMDYQSALFFVNDYTSLANRKFTVHLNELLHEQVYFEGNYEKNHLKTHAKLHLNRYSVPLLAAFHRPQQYVELGASYQLMDKFDIGTTLYYFGKQFANAEQVLPGMDFINTIELKGILDFNLKINYHYSDRLGAFFNLNNILSTRHQRWNQYPNYGINALGGVRFTF